MDLGYLLVDYLQNDTKKTKLSNAKNYSQKYLIQFSEVDRFSKISKNVIFYYF